MDFLKKFWPYSFKERSEVKQLVLAVIFQVLIGWVIGIVFGVVGGLLGAVIGILGTLVSLLGSLIGLYFTAGIVFTFLSYFKVLK